MQCLCSSTGVVVSSVYSKSLMQCLLKNRADTLAKILNMDVEKIKEEKEDLRKKLKDLSKEELLERFMKAKVSYCLKPNIWQRADITLRRKQATTQTAAWTPQTRKR